MIWQDYVITIGGIIISLSLIPAIKGDDKPPLATSVPTTVVLFVFCVTFTTIRLWVSAGMYFLAACLWMTLAIQQYAKHKR